MVNLLCCCISLTKEKFYNIITLIDIILNLTLMGFGFYLIKYQLNILSLILSTVTFLYICWEIKLYTNYLKEKNFGSSSHRCFAFLRLFIFFSSLYGITFIKEAFTLLRNYKGEGQIKLWAIFVSSLVLLFFYLLLNFIWSCLLIKVVLSPGGVYEDSEIKSDDFDD